jgi:hypothetical protein
MAKILVPSSELCTAGAAGAATKLDNSSLSLSAFLLSLSLTVSVFSLPASLSSLPLGF